MCEADEDAAEETLRTLDDEDEEKEETARACDGKDGDTARKPDGKEAAPDEVDEETAALAPDEEDEVGQFPGDLQVYESDVGTRVSVSGGRVGDGGVN
jgi:hypothetical protein